LLGQPKPFDVTLRDGLQSLSKEEQRAFTTDHKMKIYDDIVTKYNPKSVEVGSIVSEKVLPVFSDTIPLSKLIYNYHKDDDTYNRPTSHVLIPNKEKLRTVINNPFITHFSFITSVSNGFQLKNTKMSLADSDSELLEMLYILEDLCISAIKPSVRLYVSCINQCPIEGRIDNDYIIHRLLKFHNMDIDDICISDTCGSLDPEDFEYIIDTCRVFGMPMSKLSLHLHVNPDRIKTVEQIIHMAFDRKIINFDVSYLSTGGCSVTMDRSRLSPNLSYEQYYNALCKYIEKRVN